jgi:hypothetical protein
MAESMGALLERTLEEMTEELAAPDAFLTLASLVPDLEAVNLPCG